MFDENFTFSRSPSWTSSTSSTTPATREPSRSVSPCSPLSAFPPPPQGYSVTDLAAELDRQRIRPDAQIAYQPCDSYANTTDDDSAWDIPPAATTCSDSEADSTYSGSTRAFSTSTSTTSLSRMRSHAVAHARSYSPSRRSARQSGTRMLCASSHHAKDIAALVSRMVSSSDQCSVAAPPDSIPRAVCSDEESESAADADDDEGYNSCSPTATAMESFLPSSRRTKRDGEYRRAYDSRSRSGGHGAPAIAKEIRFRGKERSHHHLNHRRHRSSGEKSAGVV